MQFSELGLSPKVLTAVETAGFVTHRFPFDEAGEAYELIDRSPAEVLRATIAYA